MKSMQFSFAFPALILPSLFRSIHFRPDSPIFTCSWEKKRHGSSHAPERKKDIFSHPMSLITVKDYSTSLAVPKSSEFACYLACTRPILLTYFFNFLRAYASPYSTSCDSPKCPRSWRRLNPWLRQFHVTTYMKKFHLGRKNEKNRTDS